jgi:hypothetical protein
MTTPTIRHERRLDFASLRLDKNDPLAKRLDAGDLNVFFARQLEHIEGETYDVQYPELIGKTLVPVNSRVGRGKKIYTYRQFDKVGVAKLLASYAEDLPRVDVRGREFSVRIEGYGASFGYSIQDIRAAAEENVPLDAMKAEAARQVIETTLDKIAAIGDTDTGAVGLLNIANATRVALPNGAGGKASWGKKTTLEILADLNALANKSYNLTYGIERAGTMVLPLDAFTLISTTPMSATIPNESILAVFLKNQQFVKEVVPWYRCTNAGLGGTLDRIVVYKKDPKKLEFIEPQPFEIFPPEAKNLEFVSPCHARTAGVVCRYPLSVTYGDMPATTTDA